MLSIPMCSSSLTSLRQTLGSWDRNEKKEKTKGKEEKKKKTFCFSCFSFEVV